MFESLSKEVRELRRENEEMRRSLEFTQSEMADVQKNVTGENRAAGNEGDLRNLMGNLEDRMRLMEDYSRKGNIIVDGLAEDKEENNEKLQSKVENIFSEKLDIALNIDDLHRLGQRQEHSTRTRPVVVRLKTLSQRHQCLRSAFKLKGTNIFVNEDVSKATMDIRKTKFPELKAKRDQGLIAYFSGTRIVTKTRTRQPIIEKTETEETTKTEETEDGFNMMEIDSSQPSTSGRGRARGRPRGSKKQIIG